MAHNTTIRSEIENYIRRTGTNMQGFSKTIGLNKGILSAIINRNPPKAIAVRQVDLITAGMGLAEGALYELYVDECLITNPLNWRRLRPFLQRCAELEKYECIERILQQLAEDLSFMPGIFDTAEILYKQGLIKAAALLYEQVAEGEKYQHSERLAICQYRLFTIALSNNQDTNLRAAVKFEHYVDRLDEADQLDALKDLANIYSSLHLWDKVDELADELGKRATIQYTYNHEHARGNELKEPVRPVFAYILYSHLLRSAVCVEFGDYEQALHYVSLYSDMSWVKEDTKEAHQIMEQYGEWADANTFLYRLMSGQVSVLPDYVSYIESKESEILPALVKILQAANLYHINVDDILDRFEVLIIDYAEKQSKLGKYNKQIIEDRYTQFLSAMAIYYLDKQMYEIGINYILDYLETSVIINSENSIIQSVILFEQFRHVATNDSQEKYKNLICEVKNLNEKKFSVVSSCT